MKNQRPVNLNIFTIRFPLAAIVSILHRVSGVILFLALPLLIYALDMSLTSEDTFQIMHDDLTSPIAKIIIWLVIAPLIFHLVAGIRHLLMDFNLGIELRSSRLGAILTFIVAFALMALLGVYLW